MSSPIEKLLDAVEWQPVAPQELGPIPHVTYEGVLEFGGFKIKCLALSDGQRVLDADAEPLKSLLEELRAIAP